MVDYIHVDNEHSFLDVAKYPEACHKIVQSWQKLEVNTNTILVKEHVQSSDFLRMYFKYFNPNKNFCSHILLMENDTQRFLLTDAALNLNPSLKELEKITRNAIDFWTKIRGSEEDHPIHVNFLSNSGHLELGNQTACACQLLKDYFEISEYQHRYTIWQLDTCLYSKSRRAKGLVNEIFSTPDIIVVPNLDTGNAIYKALMHQYRCYGFIVGGITPAILNSRSDLDKNPESIKILNKVMEIL